MADELKLAVRGLPFEATKEEVIVFFGVADAQLELLTWSDSGRCRGVGFITCNDADEKARIQGFDKQTFTVDGNSRELSICQFEKRGGKKKSQEPEKERNYQTDDVTNREVFVSNTSFKATENDFRDHFRDCGEIESVTIPTQFSTGRPKGFAFVRFVERESVEQALAKLAGSTMCDRIIGVRENRGRVERSWHKPQRRSGLSEKPENCTTIFVGNLPWSADDDMLENLFADCGPVSSHVVRQSYTNRSRGFGYVEFENESAVDTAVQKSLSLEGRELRLDYAERRTSD